MRTKDDAKVDLIYKATLELVKEKGLAGITMNDISKAASLATGTLYIYFKNKEDLITALFTQCRAESATQYFEGLDKAESFEDKMHTVFTNIIQYKVSYFENSVFLEQLYHSPFGCQGELTKKQKALQPLMDLVKEGKEAGLLKDVHDELIISYTFGIINEMVKKSYFSRKKLTPEIIEQVYAMYWDGISRK